MVCGFASFWKLVQSHYISEAVLTGMVPKQMCMSRQETFGFYWITVATNMKEQWCRIKLFVNKVRWCKTLWEAVLMLFPIFLHHRKHPTMNSSEEHCFLPRRRGSRLGVKPVDPKSCMTITQGLQLPSRQKQQGKWTARFANVLKVRSWASVSLGDRHVN